MGLLLDGHSLASAIMIQSDAVKASANIGKRRKGHINLSKCYLNVPDKKEGGERVFFLKPILLHYHFEVRYVVR